MNVSVATYSHQLDDLRVFKHFRSQHKTQTLMFMNIYSKFDQYFNSFQDTIDHFTVDIDILVDHVDFLYRIILDHLNLTFASMNFNRRELFQQVERFIDLFWYEKIQIEKYSFLQPMGYRSVLDLSSFLHQILINMTNTESKSVYVKSEVFDDLPTNEELLFVSNDDKPELLVYFTSNTKRDLIIIISGLILTVCGSLLLLFLRVFEPTFDIN